MIDVIRNFHYNAISVSLISSYKESKRQFFILLFLRSFLFIANLIFQWFVIKSYNIYDIHATL